MNCQTRLLMILCTTMCLASVVLAKQGTAVFSPPPYVPSSCFGYRQQGDLVAGANPTLYDSGKVCGRSYKVRCLGGTNQTPNPCKGGEVTVKFVSLCSRCGANEINLSQESFSRIANLKAEKIRVDYTQL